MKSNRNKSERELLRTFERMFNSKRGMRGVVRGVGDDGAVLRPPAGRDLLLTADALVEGRHFQRKWLSGRELGWRLAAVNLSDIAAMAGEPLWAVLSLAVPDGVDARYVLDIERGARDHLARVGAAVVGGNVTGIDDSIVCDMTLAGSVRRGRFWERSCRPGNDAVVVVGSLGEARAGLEMLQSGRARPGRLRRAYVRPHPLLEIARLLANNTAIHGAIDVSDGFTLDLARICEAAGAGCTIDRAALSPSRPLSAYCADASKDPRDYMLYGGEDYALVLAIEQNRAASVVELIRRRTRLPAAVVGRFTRSSGRYEIIDGPKRRHLDPRGWDHLLRPRR